MFSKLILEFIGTETRDTRRKHFKTIESISWMIWMANGKYRISLSIQNTPKRVTRKYFLILLIWEANRLTECWNSQEYHYVDRLFDSMSEFLPKSWNETKQNKTNRMLWNWFAWFFSIPIWFWCYAVPFAIVNLWNVYVYIVEIADRQCEHVRSIGLPDPWPLCALFLKLSVLPFSIFYISTLGLVCQVFYYKFHQIKGTVLTTVEQHFFLLSAHIFIDVVFCFCSFSMACLNLLEWLNHIANVAMKNIKWKSNKCFDNTHPHNAQCQILIEFLPKELS